MSGDEDKALVRRMWEECLNTRDLSTLGDYFTPDFVNHSPAPAIEPNLTQLFAAFPDSHYTIEDLVAVDDKVILRWSWSDTHQGELYGVAPTGKRVTTRGVDINRLVDGTVAEVWLEWDMLGFLQQLGVVPALRPA